MTTTTEAYQLYLEFCVSESADDQILEIAHYAIKQGYTTAESLLPLVTDFVETTFGLNHGVLIEKVTTDVMYEIESLTMEM